MKKNNTWFIIFWITLIIIVIGLFNSKQKNNTVSMEYSRFKQSVKEGNVSEVMVSPGIIKGKFRDENGEIKGFKTVPMEDPDLIKDMERGGVIKFYGAEQNGWLGPLLMSWGPIILLILFWLWIMRGMAGGGKQAMSFGKSKAKLVNTSNKPVTFKDVAGCDEAKEELQEMVAFLKDPGKFQKLGGKIPKGVLLVGPPGTGKTLLAKAVAGEAGVAFFSSSGSEFVEMFVGVGASRVRDLFDQGKKSAPCLLFIDEIDAVGRHRGAGLGGGHDEREQTLNQMLVEMDGFDTKEGIILIAATNRPDVLDPALLRPGRFDRQVVVPRPELKDREAILDVHAKGVKLSKDVDLKVIARRTPGFVGADLANVINEAALLAARYNQENVTMKNLEAAIDRVSSGPERKSIIRTKEDLKKTAYHEAGHTIVAKMLPGSDPVHKVTIIPRGSSLGHMLQLPENEKFSYTKRDAENIIAIYFGGRAADTIVYNEFTTGAAQDILQATKLARRMVVEFGMSEKVGPIALNDVNNEEVFLGRDISRNAHLSEKMSEMIDSEIKRIIDESLEKATDILTKNRKIMDTMVDYLLERETLNGEEIDKIIKCEPLEPVLKDEQKSAPPKQEPEKEESIEQKSKGESASEKI